MNRKKKMYFGTLFFFKDFIYLFMGDRGKDTGRLHAGSPMWDHALTGRSSTTEPPRRPYLGTFIVVPKIANPRNHQGAHTDANTGGLIYKLELGSKYTRHSGAGTWTPRWVPA